VSSLPDPALFTWQPVAEGLESPIGLANAGDGSARLFVIEQPGRIRLITDGQLLPDPFLDIRDRVGSQGSEQGLLGLAFHPGYAQNGRFFVNYTDRSGDTIIARFTVSPEGPDRADPASEMRLISVDQPYANHNGGVLAFGPDGYLYIGLGDGGAAGDPQGNGQSLNTLLGKVLRIDIDAGDPYGIPPDNPFTNGGGLPEIWAYGLRNPWRFSFDRATGDLYLADVGQGSFEEVDYQPAGDPGGVNYGWDLMEGEACFNTPNCDPSGLTSPVFAYPTHVEGTCSVTGGYVYRGSLASMQGVYLLGDYCSGRVWGLLPDGSGGWQAGTLFETGVRISSFGEDESGEVYLVSHSGEIYRLSGR
jgi:glucose/arabinose dehydrogenase